MSSDLLNKLMGNVGLSNKENVEKARQELAGAITRVVINEALSEAKMRAQERDKMLIKPKEGEKPQG